MNASPDTNLQRLRWRCRRGLLELDYLLTDYLEQGYPQASPKLQTRFQQLLEEQDPDLQAWLLHGEACPEHLREIVDALRP